MKHIVTAVFCFLIILSAIWIESFIAWNYGNTWLLFPSVVTCISLIVILVMAIVYILDMACEK